MGNGTLNTPYIARNLLFTTHNSSHFTDVQKKQKQPFFHEGEEINLWFWGICSNSIQTLVMCWLLKLLLNCWEGREHCTVNSKTVFTMSHS